MKDVRCERCDLTVGLGCSCSGTSPKAFVPFEILISPSRFAHLPGGCNHTASQEIMERDWGRVRDPRPGLWISIGPGNPVRAQEGNLETFAVRRCQDCANAFPGAG
ncbi:hypothetical protein [Microbispora siamensis]|uniref:DUF397 domain-containing protein n=1 Tax=Microbispora siamensis TaxID=564413 RepID=A0ABQ4GG05_9ACTN|nr:hypothetical protein [Microbispora siamensis]GIH60351.1 hypothetical protein Msi02_11680 [Microbispora siamensis]